MLVLVVDDDPALRMLESAVLRSGGHEVLAAEHGGVAHELAVQRHPDLVLLDVMMPEVDGFAALELLKGDERTAAIPVVMVSARVGLEDRLRAVELGAVDFISKPFKPDALRSFVADVVLLGESSLSARRAQVLEELRRAAGKHEGVAPSGPEVEWHHGVPPLDVVADAVISLEVDGRIASINRTAENIFGYLSHEVVGSEASKLLPGLRRSPDGGPEHPFIDLSYDASTPSDLIGCHRSGAELHLEACAVPLHSNAPASLAVIVRTGPGRAYEDVAEDARQQALIADVGQQVLAGQDFHAIASHAIRSMAELLGADFACLLQCRGDDLEFRIAVGWNVDRLADARISGSTESLGGHTIELGQPVLVDDLAEGDQYPGSRNLHEAGVRSGISAPIGVGSTVTAVLEVFSRQPRKFCPNDVHFVKSLANTLAAALEREQREHDTRMLFQALPDATLVVGRDGRINTANVAASQLFGYDVSELQSMTVEDLIPSDARVGHRALREGYQRNPRVRPMGEASSFRGLRRDGREVPVDVMVSPLDTKDGAMTVATVRDVTERNRLDAMRDAFLHAVSHELRTPLTSVLGFSDLLLSADLVRTAPEEAREYVAHIHAGALRLDRLLSDLLDLDRLARGVLEPQRSETDVESLIRGIIGSLATNSHPVSFTSRGDLTRALVDASKVERIVENLVVNAVKHTPPGTPVHVAAERRADGIALKVEDEGPGVPADLAPEVFEPFRRGNGESHAPGTGIGLSLVARFADLHGGRAWLASSPSGGASFNVLLPEQPEQPE